MSLQAFRKKIPIVYETLRNLIVTDNMLAFSHKLLFWYIHLLKCHSDLTAISY